MSHLAAYLIISTAIVCSWYLVGSLRMFRLRGLDPSLITYVTPLSVAGYKSARTLSLLAVITAFAPGHNTFGLIVPITLGMLGMLAAGMLILFSRTGTQPFVYYVLLGTEGACLSLNFPLPARLGVALALIAAQELYLRHWLSRKNAYYDKWVANEVKRLHASYKEIINEVSPYERFFVLHFAVTEGIARPAFSRFIERLYYYVRRPATISSGIMQVQADRLLSDQESMRRGSHIICDALRRMPKDLKDPLEQLKWLARDYNGSINQQATEDYTSFLLATYPGLLMAWEVIGN